MHPYLHQFDLYPNLNSTFTPNFIKTIMSVREGTTKADDAFNSKQLKDIFKTVIYNYNNHFNLL